ncbi:MAG: hypothetical protein HY720_31655 [Planctomycetes bacterium]|nr:hypothetical protein [Planctomycetota bacterium]
MTNRFTLALVLSVALLAGAANAQQKEGSAFQFGLYGAGADREGMVYWTRPAGAADAGEYFREAFRRAAAEGFDYVTFNHNQPEDLPMILAEAERAGVPYLYEGGGWPSYYDLSLVDPDTGELVLDTTMGFQEFGPESSSTPYLRERLHRRRTMRDRMLPWIRDSWPALARHPWLAGYTPVEEPPVDPMIDDDLAEVGKAFRAADPGRHTLAMIYKDIRTLAAGVPLMRPDLVRAGFFGIGRDSQAGEFGGNWWYAEDTTDDAATVCREQGARYHVFVSGAAEEVYEGGRWVPGSFRRVTVPELRGEFWIAILSGANGIEVFCYNSIDDSGHIEHCERRGVEPFEFGSGPVLGTRMFGLYDMRDEETELLQDLRTVLAEIRPLCGILGDLVPIERRRGGEDFPSGVFPYRRDGVSAIRAREFVHTATSKRYLGLWNGDVARGRSVDLDLGIWSRGLPVRVVPDGEVTTAATLGANLLLPPGGGVLVELDPK